ncbi:MAG: hypothetical protein JWN34_3112 [Bryobacterales bacterium]|nr:hypothetical protein [Bryobacterales bacterium]
MLLLPVRQLFPERPLPDVAAAVQAELVASGLASKLKPGASVAIGAGSRGISNIATIIRAIVDYFSAAGMKPSVFPAMGSHGAGTAEGQASVLAHYGISEATMGCPVVSRFDTTSLGRTELGVETFAGNDALSADAIFLASRVKWHTSFAGAIESGVCKMIAIGLGKLDSAKSAHMHGRKHAMEAVIRSVASHILATGRILGGLAILEDAHHNTAKVAALPAHGLIEREELLLETVKSWMPRLPVPEIDILIVDEIGKNISGTGMDLKVVNRNAMAAYNPWPDTPRVQRIFVRDLSSLSYGNAVGIGAADIVHSRMVAKVDPHAGRVNAETAGSLAMVRTPLHFPTDRECFDLLTNTVGKPSRKEVTVVWIRNTMELGTMAVSENLAGELSKNPAVEITGPAFSMLFDDDGQLKANLWA